MKNTKHILTAAFVALAVIFFAFKGIQEQQKLKVELTIPEWENVLQVIDQSNAPHSTVVYLRTELLRQLQGQLQTDSLNQNQ